MVDVIAEPLAASAEPAPARARPRPLVRWWWALALAVASGLVLLVAFPPYGQWWTAPIGVALLAIAVHRRGFWAGFGLGTLTGLALLVPLLEWAGGYVGPVWLILPCAFALYVGVMGGVAALSSPVPDRWPWTWPIATGAVWTLQEALRDRTPFGGFPWGRIAFSQADSPLLGLAALGGAPLVTFGAAALGGLLAAAVVLVHQHGWRRPQAPAAVATALALVWVPLTVPTTTTKTGGADYTVAIVQGNVPRLGLDFNAQRRAVLTNHANATIQLAHQVETGAARRPDLVVWPENSSDVDPFLDQAAGDQITAAARSIGVPILVGGVLQGPGPNQSRNAGIIWDPTTGPGEMYLKRHPVPFAEYIPIRSFARKISDKVDLVRTEFVAGDRPGVLSVPGAKLGDVICFEVAYDEVVRDTVTGGAQLLVVQTNNATFNEAEARQQLAMVQLRAVEHGRPALMASTVGISGFVDEHGVVSDATTFNAPAVVVREIGLRDGRTLATTLGALPELTLTAAAIAILALAIGIRLRQRKERAVR